MSELSDHVQRLKKIQAEVTSRVSSLKAAEPLTTELSDFEPSEIQSAARLAAIERVFSQDKGDRKLPSLKGDAPGESSKSPSFDLVVVQALAEENIYFMKALRDIGDSIPNASFIEEQSVLKGNTEYLEGKIVLDSTGTSIKVAISFQPRMGMIDASIHALNALTAYKPKYYLMTGVCAGVRDECSIGDLLVGSRYLNADSGKIREGEEFDPEFHVCNLDPAIEQRVQAKINGLPSSVFESLVRDSDLEPGKVRFVPIASGSSVIASNKRVKKITAHDRKVVGIEMEAYGAARAIESQPNRQSIFLCVKGVCDYADEDKNDKYRQIPGINASIVALGIIVPLMRP